MQFESLSVWHFKTYSLRECWKLRTLGISRTYTCIHLYELRAFISICFVCVYSCVCVCVCVCVSVFICGQARPTLSEYLNNSTQWWPLLNCGGKNQPCGSNLAMERTNRYPHNVAIECVYGRVCVCMSMCIYNHEWVHRHICIVQKV